MYYVSVTASVCICVYVCVYTLSGNLEILTPTPTFVSRSSCSVKSACRSALRASLASGKQGIMGYVWVSLAQFWFYGTVFDQWHGRCSMPHWLPGAKRFRLIGYFSDRTRPSGFCTPIEDKFTFLFLLLTVQQKTSNLNLPGNTFGVKDMGISK